VRLALIPARGGSKRIPRKNIRPFAGRPIIGWPIAAAQASGLFDRIVCSTDDDEIAAIAERLGAEAPFRRPAALADDHATTLDVILHALDWAEAEGLAVTALCCVYPTAPFVTAADLRAGLARMEACGAGYCLPVARFPAPIQRAIRRTADGRLDMIQPEHFTTRSQDLEPAYFDTGTFYWGRPATFRARERMFGPAAVPLEMPLWRAVDIDTPEDWERAEKLWQVIQGGAGAGA
jgi:N-acylneuraminate cytidylyltransferase